jgi:hypothetical protein
MQEYNHLDPQNIANNLRLDVQNISQQQITYRKHDLAVDRQHDPPAGTEDSFNWVVDLENIELYDRSIKARTSAFNPILTFTNGELFTNFIPKNALFTVRGLFDRRKFGFVGSAIGAEFRLDQPPNSKAVFHNGQQPLTPPDPNKDWEIEINNDGPAHSGVVTDANHYYKAVGLSLTEPERFLFMCVGGTSGPAGPEAACFTAFLGKSLPEG